MVHALREIWRVLRADGTLVDLRPLPTGYPIELVTPGAVVQVGELDGSGMIGDDEAADRAVQRVVEEGWFVSGQDSRLDFTAYWDSVRHMTSNTEPSSRIRRVAPSHEELEEAHRELAQAGGSSPRIRFRMRMMLAVHRRAEPRADRVSRLD